MRTGFVLPSCNYNIVLSEDDLKQLLDKGYITINPLKTNGIFIDECGNRLEVNSTSLTYGENDDYPVQFISVILEK